jgi:hypothetical protein
MAATGFHVNVTDVNFQPGGTGSLLPIDGAKEATLDYGVQVIKESGDADIYMSIAAAVGQDPTIAISSNRAFQLLTVSGGTAGTLTFKVPDSHSGVTTGQGGYQITVTNAVFEKHTKTFGHRRFAGLAVAFSTYSTDGVTSPISIVAL